MKLIVNVRIFLSLVSLMLTFNACSGYQSPRYVKVAHQITAKTADKIEHEKNLHLIGTGGRMMDHIRMMAMSFNLYQEVTLEQTRSLLLYVVTTYLDAINQSDEIRPYLSHYPFTPQDIEIRIAIYKPDRSEPPLDKICYASAVNDSFHYYVARPETHSMQSIHKETYEQAVQLHEKKTAPPITTNTETSST